jgi:Protein of unknown function (DUF2778)
MSWTYNSSNGSLSRHGELVGQGYSGYPPHVNDVSAESIPDVGPIPRGAWIINAPFFANDTGPYSLPLTPAEGTETFGRSGFRIHGDEISEAGKELASHGCIVMPLNVREAVWQSGDTDLEVV